MQEPTGAGLLAYLEGLAAALIARDGDEVHRLLRHPLAVTLPRAVREEALAIVRAGTRTMRAPIQTLRFYHQTVQLVRGSPARETVAEPETVEQIRLPLAANDE